MDAIKFRNWTKEDFSWKWDGLVHNFKAEQEIYLEAPKAKHFAKHLTDRELNRANLPTNSPKRAEFEARCFPTDEVISQEQALNIREKAKADAKKSKKVTKKEVEFAELKEKDE